MNQAILITGAGTGIGKALAIKLAQAGYTILGVGRRVEPLQSLKQQLPEKIEIIAADIANPDDRTKIVTKVQALQKPLYLVHNAATVQPIALLKDVTLADWRLNQATNVEAPLFLTQALLPYLKNGRVLHISSGLAHFACPGVGTYCVSKAALHMLYLCLRDELKELAIAVGSASPGVVDTPMQNTVRHATKEQLPAIESFIRFKESGKLVSPTVVADFLQWLLLETNQEVFSEKDWDISDTSHHHYWLKHQDIQWQVDL